MAVTTILVNEPRHVVTNAPLSKDAKNNDRSGGMRWRERELAWVQAVSAKDGYEACRLPPRANRTALLIILNRLK